MSKKQQALNIVLGIAIVLGLALTAFFVVRALTVSPKIENNQTESTTTPETTNAEAPNDATSSSSKDVIILNPDGSTTTKKADGSTVTVKDATNGYEEVTTVDASGKSSTVLRPKQ